MNDGDGDIVLYWRPGCTFCILLRLRLRAVRLLRHRKLRYTKVNIWRDADAAAFVRSVADGNETVPTVTVGSTTMVNPSPRRLLAAVRSEAPHLLA